MKPIKGVPWASLLHVRIGDTVTTIKTHSLDWFRGVDFEVVGLQPVAVQLEYVKPFYTNEGIDLYLSSIPQHLLEVHDESGITDLLMRVGVRHPFPHRDIAWLGPGDIEAITKQREKSP